MIQGQGGEKDVPYKWNSVNKGIQWHGFWGETSGSAQLVRCMVMDKRMKLQSWGIGGRAEQSSRMPWVWILTGKLWKVFKNLTVFGRLLWMSNLSCVRPDRNLIDTNYSFDSPDSHLAEKFRVWFSSSKHKRKECLSEGRKFLLVKI